MLELRATYQEDISSGMIVVSAFAPSRRAVAARLSINVGRIDKRSVKLADRLCAAIDANKAFTNARIATDVNGAEYLHFDVQVRGRCLAADLKALGF